MIVVEIEHWPTSINFYTITKRKRGTYQCKYGELLQKWTEYIYARIRVRIHTNAEETAFKGVSNYS